MELSLIKHPIYRSKPNDEQGLTMVSPVTDAIKPELDHFLSNYCPNSVHLDKDRCFVLHINIDGHFLVTGLFVFENNDANTKVPYREARKEKVFFHELTHIVIDESLWNEKFLSASFKKMFPQLMHKDDYHREVLWPVYMKYVSSVVTKEAKQDKFYTYQNESNYFAQKLMEGYHSSEKKEMELIVR